MKTRAAIIIVAILVPTTLSGCWTMLNLTGVAGKKNPGQGAIYGGVRTECGSVKLGDVPRGMEVLIVLDWLLCVGLDTVLLPITIPLNSGSGRGPSRPEGDLDRRSGATPRKTLSH